ncbi:MAG: hypothetical protein XD76_0597 [candidate division TA06 bacterium 32_111]|uniref:Uncharacterized protein n=2 Tax=Bacteria candidate phyla TaxID=1783234 RepID=A0A101I2W9_UNCT6|nr:MAG: hypothetical protein XD76_0597 [candidate division TA06 bacterium 32_111]KUK87783.1 MAG: hypothetical protein XE03_0302 [candidate division TA06 bacterium 34_109]HAF07938.1 hypothetical protein [candidate division WOR-3 bacterium]HCP16360.1 hypothetical protein [candidate division WOR-3 bacterium]
MKNLFSDDETKIDDMQGDFKNSRAVCEEVYKLYTIQNRYAQEKSKKIILNMGQDAAPGLLHSTITQLNFIKQNKRSQKIFKGIINELIINNNSVKKFFLKYGIAESYTEESRKYFKEIFLDLKLKKEIDFDYDDKKILRNLLEKQDSSEEDKLLYYEFINEYGPQEYEILKSLIGSLIEKKDYESFEKALQILCKIVEQSDEEIVENFIKYFFKSLKTNHRGYDKKYKEILKKNPFKINLNNYKKIISSLEESHTPENTTRFGKNRYIKEIFCASIARINEQKERFDLLIQINDFIEETGYLLKYWFEAINKDLESKNPLVEHLIERDIDDDDYIFALFLHYYLTKKWRKKIYIDLEREIDEMIKEPRYRELNYKAETTADEVTSPKDSEYISNETHENYTELE